MDGNNRIIEINNLTKTYSIGDIKVNALNGINLEIKKGEFVAIMGPSGSGKSTLMNILGCLDTPTDGNYFLENRDVSKLNDNSLAEIRNKKIGFVFQTFNLLSKSNIIDNVDLPLIYSKNKLTKTKKELIQEVILSLGLNGRQKHKPSELSGGQRQRVAIARALVNNPAIILADEPTGNLDSRTGEEIMAIFQDLNENGRTILIVTHELDIAKHTKRIIYLKDGMIINEEKISSPLSAEKILEEMPYLEKRMEELKENNADEKNN